MMVPVQTATVTITSTPLPTSAPLQSYVVIVYAQFAHQVDFPESQTDFNKASLESDNFNATILFCSPGYQLESSSVTLDAYGALVDIVPNGTIVSSDMPTWNLVAALQNSLSSSFQALAEDTVAVHKMGDDEIILNSPLDPFFNVLQAISPTASESKFLDGHSLEQDAKQLFKAYSAQTAKNYLTVASNKTNDNASYERIESRLVIHNLSLRLLESLLVLLMACSITLILIGPGGTTLSDPSSIARTAVTLAHSHDLMAVLTGTGDKTLETISQRLGTSTFGVLTPCDWKNNGAYGIQTALASDHERAPSKSDKLEWWQPLAFHTPFKIIVLVLPVILIFALEVTYQVSRKSHGLCDVRDSAHFAWTLLPASVLTLFKLLVQCVAWAVSLMDPYRLLKQGSSNARLSLFSSHLPKSALELLYSGTSLGRLALISASLVKMIGPFLTIVSSGLLSTDYVAGMNTVNATLLDHLPVVPYDRDWQSGALAAANLLILGSYPYPAGTYDNIIYPNLDWRNLNSSHASGEALINATTMSVETDALRADMNCTIVDPSNIVYNFTRPSPGSYDIEFTYLELAGCSCNDYTADGYPCHSDSNEIPSFGGKFSTNESTFWGLFEDRLLQSTWTTPDQWADFAALTKARDPVGPCPNITALYADFDVTSVNMTVIQRTWSLQEVSANITYNLEKQSVASVGVSEVLNSTSDLGSYPFQNTISTYMDEYTHTDEDQGMPNFFMALLNGSDSSAVLTPDNGPHIAESMGFIYRTFATQYTNTAHRVSLSTGSKKLPANITNVHRERLVQNTISTRTLQGLLAAMLLFTAITYILFDCRELLPKNPCSIVALASLLAESDFLDLIPEGSEWCSDEVLLQTEPFTGHFLSLGWWGKDSEAGQAPRFGIDVGKPV